MTKDIRKGAAVTVVTKDIRENVAFLL